MRIRKNARQSPLPLSHVPVPEALRTHVCQLNQSPWDVTDTLSPPSPPYQQPPYPTLPYQFDAEDSLTGNGSLGDSVGAVESSVASMMDDAEEKAAIHDDNCAIKSERLLDDNEDSKMEDPYEFDDGPSEPTLKPCSIHSQDNSTQYSKKAQKQVVVGGSRRGRPRTVKKGSSSAAANPYEFYYYSGFGPSWRKRRGERGGEARKDSEEKECEKDNSIITQNNTAPFDGSQTQRNDNNSEDHFDYTDDEDEEEENGRKRTRKPVKARSLKSLM